MVTRSQEGLHMGSSSRMLRAPVQWKLSLCWVMLGRSQYSKPCLTPSSLHVNHHLCMSTILPDSPNRLLIHSLQHHLCLTGSCVPSYDHHLPISCSRPMHTGQYRAGQVTVDLQPCVISVVRYDLLHPQTKSVSQALFRHAPTAQAFPEHLADSPLRVLAIGSWLLLLECTLCQ